MKPTREEVLRLMRQASGGILTQVAEDPSCGYEIKVEELQTFAELLQASHECGNVPDGFAIVPIYATPDIRVALCEILRRHGDGKTQVVQDVWDELLSAANEDVPSGMQPPNTAGQPNEQKSYVGNFGDTGEAQLRRELANVPLPNYMEGK